MTGVALSGVATLLCAATPAAAQSAAVAARPAPAAGVSNDAQAADAPAGGVATSGEIIVTARGREQRLQDVPVAVSVVSGASLQQANLNTLQDVASRLPDLKISTGTITNSLAIRGVGSGANAGFEQSVATFVDGIYRSRSRSTTAALFDVQRVEVLKGPQTTFFGANAIAGALNIITRKPGTELDYNGSVDYVFKTGEYNAQVGIDVPLTPTFSARLAGRLFGSNGYVKNDRTGDESPHNRASQGRLSLRWEPSSSFRSDLRVEGSHSRNDGASPFQVVGCPPPSGFTLAATNTCARYLKQNGGIVDDTLDDHTSIGKTFVNYDYIDGDWTNRLSIGRGSLTSITGYFRHTYNSQGQGIPFPLTDAIVGSDGFPSAQLEHFHQVSQELRYQSPVGGLFEYMVGGYVEHGDLDMHSVVGFRYQAFGAKDTTNTYNASSPFAGNNIYRQKDTTLSAFASGTLRPIDHLRINFGGRFSSIRKEAHRSAAPGLSSGEIVADSFQEVSPANQAIIAGLIATNRNDYPQTKRTDNKFMPSASIQYDLSPEVMVYASYANGFKAGGFSFGANNEIFQPEVVNDYEVGFKGQFFDRRLSTDITVYRSDYTNLQESVLQLQSNGTISSLIQNVAGSRSQGVEFTGGLKVTSWLTVNSSIAYLDATYNNYTNGACTIYALFLNSKCTQNLTGKHRSFAPEWSGNVGATLSVPVNGDYRLTVDPLLYFTSSYFQSSTADPLLEQQANAKVDLRIAFGPSNHRWQFAVLGKNLTNKTTASYRQAIPLAPGSVSALVDPPFTVGVQFTIRR